MSTSISASERRWLLICSIGVLALASLPYLVGVLTAAPDRVFSGLQVNPLDGVSYLAKMQIGLHGDWLFTLRFTTESSAGVFLFTYFIALGQLARLLNLPLILIFHAARLMGGFALLWQIYRLIARVASSIDLRRRAWWLIALSSGLGLAGDAVRARHIVGYDHRRIEHVLQPDGECAFRAGDGVDDRVVHRRAGDRACHPAPGTGLKCAVADIGDHPALCADRVVCDPGRDAAVDVVARSSLAATAVLDHVLAWARSRPRC